MKGVVRKEGCLGQQINDKFGNMYTNVLSYRSVTSFDVNQSK